MRFYLDTRTQPHPLPQPATSRFAAHRKRYDKPPTPLVFNCLFFFYKKRQTVLFLLIPKELKRQN
jgi:hypothetical protein